MTVDITKVKAANAERWARMRVDPSRAAALDRTSRRLCAPAAKARYQAISLAVWGTPERWWFVAVVHEREAGQDFTKQLGQGDPLGRTSIHEPAGRGPFFDHPGDPPWQDAFYRGALDALIDCAPHAAKWNDWSSGGVLTLLEEYNGLGYAARGVPSAYVWSGSDQYVSGKFVADHVYRASAVDVQEGCAPLLARMALVDSSVRVGAGVAPTKRPPVVAPSHAGGAVVTGAGAAAAAHQAGLSWHNVAIIGISVAAVVLMSAVLTRLKGR